MKNITIIIILIMITLCISRLNEIERLNKKNLEHIKKNDKLKIDIIELETRVEGCFPKNKIELGSAEWFPTRNEWTNMSEQEKISWEKQYNFLNE
jgi:hypothetical protein